MLEEILRLDHIRESVFQNLPVKDLLALRNVTPEFAAWSAAIKLTRHIFNISGAQLYYRECLSCDTFQDSQELTDDEEDEDLDDSCPAPLEPFPLYQDNHTPLVCIEDQHDLLSNIPAITRVRLNGKKTFDQTGQILLRDDLRLLSLHSAHLTHLDLRLSIGQFPGERAYAELKKRRSAEYLKVLESLPVFERVTHLKLGLYLGKRSTDDIKVESIEKWKILQNFPACTNLKFDQATDYIPRLDHLPNPQLVSHLGVDQLFRDTDEIPLGNATNFSTTFNLISLSTLSGLTHLQLSDNINLPSVNGGIDWEQIINEEVSNPSLDTFLPLLSHLTIDLYIARPWIVPFLMAINEKCCHSIQRLTLHLHSNSNRLAQNFQAFYHHIPMSKFSFNFKELELSKYCTFELLATMIGRVGICKTSTLIWTLNNRNWQNLAKLTERFPNIIFNSITRLVLKGIVRVKSLKELLAKFPSLTALALDLTIVELPSPDSFPPVTDLLPTTYARLKELTLSNGMKLTNRNAFHLVRMVTGLEALESLTLECAPQVGTGVNEPVNLWNIALEFYNVPETKLKSLTKIIVQINPRSAAGSLSRHTQVKHENEITRQVIASFLPRHAGLDEWRADGFDSESKGAKIAEAWEAVAAAEAEGGGDTTTSTTPAPLTSIRWRRSARNEITFTKF